QKMGNRISDMTLLSSNEPINASKSYTVGGWASVNEGTEGPPIYDLVSDYIRKKKTINVQPNSNIKIIGA
ncbi:MAG: thiosulfohydrolase SoxB, partial [Rhodospirillaceae bacterium]|nr:thiosulfohydrolase SoxB [Rhodospirillaceae bacterium]